ncbi:hypothetical protein [Lacinutrix sp. WUR7]|uniref:hypothetical protein n=1 Tax=Lacinutrix sp. WUR7 TaxID=2653681 RepID=UPI00193E9D70|nr:hypothetical protein [Lacinutrix sp. WUR7]
MKTTQILVTLFISSFSFAQTLELKKIEKESYSFFDSYTFEKILVLEKNLKTTAPYKKFEAIPTDNLVFTPQNFNRLTAYPDFTSYTLKNELRKVMLEIPGQYRPINPDSF